MYFFIMYCILYTIYDIHIKKITIAIRQAPTSVLDCCSNYRATSADITSSVFLTCKYKKDTPDPQHGKSEITCLHQSLHSKYKQPFDMGGMCFENMA